MGMDLVQDLNGPLSTLDWTYFDVGMDLLQHYSGPSYTLEWT